MRKLAAAAAEDAITDEFVHGPWSPKDDWLDALADRAVARINALLVPEKPSSSPALRSDMKEPNGK